ncbi:MAG: HI0074 family nucleotidyltransferase substrate-binding subunit [Acidimicrobiaceae bacterium]|nr:HI0074 family nucleotidyltransferase substrate-binding subunit [Acidimicrobiaceae bacterium]
MPLILDHLGRSIKELDAVYSLTQDRLRMSEMTDVAQRAMRAAAIKNFEITYELCRQLSLRWLKENSPVGSKIGLTQAELYRQAAANGLISDPEQWMHYHRDRNNAAHEYNESKIVKIYESVGLFIVDARQLFDALAEKND